MDCQWFDKRLWCLKDTELCTTHTYQSSQVLAKKSLNQQDVPEVKTKSSWNSDVTLSFKCISLQKVSNFKFGFSRQSGFHKMRELSHCRSVSQRQNIECEAFSSNIGLWPSVSLALRHETMAVACDTHPTTPFYPYLLHTTPYHPLSLISTLPSILLCTLVTTTMFLSWITLPSLGLFPAPFSSPLHPPAHHPQPLFTENPASTLISSHSPCSSPPLPGRPFTPSLSPPLLPCSLLFFPAPFSSSLLSPLIPSFPPTFFSFLLLVSLYLFSFLFHFSYNLLLLSILFTTFLLLLA